MADAAENEIAFKITVPGATEGAAEFAKLAQSMQTANNSLKATSNEAKASSQSLRLVVDNTKKASDEFRGVSTAAARVGSTLNIVGYSATKLSPQLGELVQAAGRAGGAFTAMTTVLGGGIGGLAAGGLIAAFNIWSEATQQAEQDQQALAEAVKKTNDAIEETNKLARQAAYGAGIPEISQIAALRTNIAQMRAGGILTPQRQRDIEDNERAIAALEAQRQQRQAQESLAASSADFDAQVRRAASLGSRSAQSYLNPGGPGATPRGDTEFQREMAQVNAAETSFRKGQEASAAAAEHDNAKIQSEMRIRTQKDMLDTELDNQRDHERKVVQLAKERDRELERIDEQTKKRHDELREVGISTFSAIGAQGIAALQKLAKGQKVTVKDLLSGIGDEMVAEGTRYLFKGGAELLLGNPGGAGVAAIGAAEIAAGIGLGAATRGGNAPAGGRGSSVASGPTYWNGSEFVRGQPYGPSGFPGSPGGGPGNVYVTVQMPPVPVSTADVGTHIDRALDEAKRQGKIRGYQRAA